MVLNINIHLKEIKYRILYISLSFLFTFFSSYLNVTYIIYILTLPFLHIKKLYPSFNQSDFIFTNVFEAFSSYLFVSIIVTGYLLLPLIFYSCFCFLTPGLTKNEKKTVGFVIKFFLFCCILAIVFTHQFFLPLVLKFFLSFEKVVQTNLFTLKLEPRILDYLHMSIHFFFVFSFIFQIPLSLWFFLNQKLINFNFLEKNRKLFLITFVIFGGIVSPPDVYAQLIIALPLCLFFEFILFFSYLKSLYDNKRRFLERYEVN